MQHRADRKRPAGARRWLAVGAALLTMACQGRLPTAAPARSAEAWGSLRRLPVASPQGFRLSGAPAPADGATATLDAAHVAGLTAAAADDPTLDAAQRRHILLWRDLAAGDITAARRRLAAAAPSAATDWLNDAGIAYAEWALRHGQPEDFEAALKALAGALNQADFAGAARFNRALLFQRLGLSEQAQSEWARYLADERSAAWATAAQRHLSALTPSPPDAARLWEAFAHCADHPDGPETEAFLASHLGRLVEGLGAAAEAFLTSGDEQRLAQVQRVADAARKRANERWGSDLAQALAGIQASGGASDWLAARRAFRAARQLYPIEGKPTAAEPLYAQARRAFLALGDSASALEAELGLVYCAVQRTETLQLDRLSSALLAEARQRGYVRLEGQALRVRAQLALRQSDAPAAVALAQASLTRFASLSDWEETQRSLLILSDAYERQGDSAAALRSLRELLDIGAQQGTNPRRRAQACAFAARTCAAAGACELGLAFAEEARAAAVGQAFPAFQLDAETLLATLFVKTGRFAEADAALDRAAAVLAGVADARARDVLALDFLPTAAWCRMALGDPAAALRLCARAAESLRRGRHDAYWPLTQSVRGAAYLALGDDRAAEAALRAGIDWMETARGRITKTPDRQRFFHRHADLYERLARIHAQRGQPDIALAWLERARARTLLDRRQASGKSGSGNLSPRALQRRLPDDIAAVAYAVGDHQTEVFTLDRQRLRHQTLPIGRERLAAQVQALTQALTNSSGDVAQARQAGQELYASLLSPLALSLEDVGRLVIIPDDSLHGLPWATLRDPQGRWLAERVPFSICPSVTALIRALEARPPDADAETLIVADARLSPAAADALPPLTGARDEIACLQSILGPARALAGDGAAKRQTLAALRTAGIAHLAVHGVAEPDEPLRSALYLTAADEDDGRLTAAEVYEQTFPRLRLVALSACESALGRPLRGEGMTGLAQAFLAAGAATVVATLARVEDRAMRDLMCAFHAAHQAGASPAKALQAAQRECLTQHPARWGLVIVLGAP
ncbi:MAG: hypothetical protein CFK52_10055 [Chloracidobacterium sp. CP2_5A]|nr:MAG: hypothetical protein CFK52_10055 [Chloracidobacterium sp. CP2_5A]